MKVIPAIDLMEGKVVRLEKGDKSKVTHYEEDALEVALKFSEMGFDRIHVVDLQGAFEGKPVHLNIVDDIKKNVTARVQVGGGFRSPEDIEKGLGVADFIMVSSMAFSRKKDFWRIVNKYPGRIILTLDIKQGRIATKGWLKTEDLSVKDILEEFKNLPLESILVTCVDRDGTLLGPDLETLRNVLQVSPFKVMYAGGIGNDQHVLQVRGLNSEKLSGIVVGKAIYENKIDLKKLVNI